MTGNPELVLTPTVARVARRSLFWVAITGILLLFAITLGAVATSTEPGTAMSATNPAPSGAKALAEVLKAHGVDVTVTDTLDETLDAIANPATTTLFYYDGDLLLSAEQEERLFGVTDTMVLLDPSANALELISTDIAPAGYVDGTLSAGCDVDAARAAERISALGSGYRLLNENSDVRTCFSSGGVYSLLQTTNEGTTYTVLGTTDALTNGSIATAGNAALGLNLLGGTEQLVWYLPTAADFQTETASMADVTPDWVIPVAVIGFLIALAAMFWRGRRLGPLVVENLPVTVRASETMRGRARLYEKANARLHTLDSLRIGTIARVATACGLPVLATVDEVVLAAAAASGRDQHDVKGLLVEAVPMTDHALVQLSDELLRLEQIIAENLRPH